MSSPRVIKVFEHQPLLVGESKEELAPDELSALQRYCGKGTPYFSLIHRGVKFNEHVGVLQAGNLTIEVLPKADYEEQVKGENEEQVKTQWQTFLITMLRAASIFPEATSTASLHLKTNSILDLYLLLFLKEVRYLMQTGLVRKYRKTEGNSTALKGSLIFSQNIRHNLTHAERFYVRHTVYDRNNRFNAILLKTIELIRSISHQPGIRSEASALLLDFPECADVKISETLFNTLSFDRKTAAYQKSIGIAKLLLLRFHPDVRKGRNEVLALMFDMNQLWEKFVFKRLRQGLDESKYVVREQVRNEFWEPDSGYMRIVKPDIVVYEVAEPQRAIAVLDTKWKRLKNDRVDDADLKQMLVYNLYNKCDASTLVYPATNISKGFRGKFIHNESSCCAMFLKLENRSQQGITLVLEPLIEWIEKCANVSTSKI